MERILKEQKQHIIYGLILLVVIIGFVLTGSYQINRLEKDYNSRVDTLSSSIEKKLQDKQDQITKLSGEIQKTSEQVTETSKQYETQFGELSQRIGDLAVDSESFSSVISDVIDATVTVVTNVGQGSGAIITSDGYVVTNYHVIQGASKASIYTYDGEGYAVKLIGYDVKEDLAVLKMVSNNTFDYFKFGDSDSLVAGQKVVALGNPAGLSFTATEGIISSPSREVSGKDYIQTDVTINPGNSGGPLINSLGEIVGIVNFKISNYEELGFAIPSNRVEKTVDEIMSKE
ncbi:MAG: trypsin-like peptidase domain-containing protein [Candidatus Nanoarchaeia archaeon]|nr:trypsin-like peptidase domain-containing protein [Candidatus Nanoarchaeia archaeon]